MEWYVIVEDESRNTALKIVLEKQTLIQHWQFDCMSCHAVTYNF
jgi:hypothetical protein